MYDTSFIDELASAAPTPGGGGASAYAGALAAALASMVGNLTVGKKTYADVEDEVRASLDRLDALRSRLIALVDEDARAFEPLAAAYRLPKATPEEQAVKNAALQQALIGASDIPLAIMRVVAEVVDEADYLAHHGSKMARSDAGVAAAFARAASDGASLNIFINAASMDDAAQAARYRGETESLAARTRERCDELFDFVKTSVS
ncbi:cyclodeaminase/cyclohydrolase family protein [Arabiibacter massiliensis]|uniref:cyclodeaminase/cyclohydrolase family protein n=1 Tax=Arabiibacter massiliensis TaxID=1870985 RepID=UPI0009BB0024|nr:cyclodeaminase/cyclohydrolase family protein [Arabiibacter massiliensis]